MRKWGVLLVFLTACAEVDVMPPPPPLDMARAEELAKEVRDCLARAAARYDDGYTSADIVAEAVLGQCGTELFMVNAYVGTKIDARAPALAAVLQARADARRAASP